jgi:hypothetical protein
MKKYRVVSSVSLVALALASTLAVRPAHAAREIGLGAAFDPRVPIGSFREFSPDATFRGLQAKLDYFPLDALSIGLDVQYNLFRRDLATDTVEIPNGAATAPTFRYMSFWSVLPTARYYASSSTFRPYAELGVGLSSTNASVLVSDLSVRDVGAALIVQPSIGVLWKIAPGPGSTSDGGGGEALPPAKGFHTKPLDSLFGLTASLTYSFTTADAGRASNVMYAGIQVGIYAKP